MCKIRGRIHFMNPLIFNRPFFTHQSTLAQKPLTLVAEKNLSFTENIVPPDSALPLYEKLATQQTKAIPIKDGPEESLSQNSEIDRSQPAPNQSLTKENASESKSMRSRGRKLQEAKREREPIETHFETMPNAVSQPNITNPESISSLTVDNSSVIIPQITPLIPVEADSVENNQEKSTRSRARKPASKPPKGKLAPSNPKEVNSNLDTDECSRQTIKPIRTRGRKNNVQESEQTQNCDPLGKISSSEENRKAAKQQPPKLEQALKEGDCDKIEEFLKADEEEARNADTRTADENGLKSERPTTAAVEKKVPEDIEKAAGQVACAETHSSVEAKPTRSRTRTKQAPNPAEESQSKEKKQKEAPNSRSTRRNALATVNHESKDQNTALNSSSVRQTTTEERIKDNNVEEQPKIETSGQLGQPNLNPHNIVIVNEETPAPIVAREEVPAPTKLKKLRNRRGEKIEEESSQVPAESDIIKLNIVPLVTLTPVEGHQSSKNVVVVPQMVINNSTSSQLERVTAAISESSLIQSPLNSPATESISTCDYAATAEAPLNLATESDYIVALPSCARHLVAALGESVPSSVITLSKFSSISEENLAELGSEHLKSSSQITSDESVVHHLDS